MLHRTLAIPLLRAAMRGRPAILQGPRGSGKTTLARREFPAHAYFTLEDPGLRALARSRPGEFWARLRGPAIVDDAHRAPELLRQLPEARPLLLLSSRRLRLPLETFDLYAPTEAERAARPPLSLEMLGHFAPAPATRAPAPLPPNRSWLYRDVRELIHVRDLDRFERFHACAVARSAHVLDQQALATEAGVSHATVARWLRVLDDCFQTLRLLPSDLDFGRRLVRSPKLHLLDSPSVESRAVWALFQNARHLGSDPRLTYWRDSNGFEIELVVDIEGAPPMPVSIAAQPTPAHLARLHRWMQLAGVARSALISEHSHTPRRGPVVGYSLGQL